PDGAQRLIGLTQGDSDALVQRRCSGGADLTEVPVHLGECAGPTHGYGASSGRPWHRDDSSHWSDNPRLTPDGDTTASDTPQRLGGGQPCGADGGEEPGERADEQGGGERAGPGLGRDDEKLVVAAGVCGGGGRADGYAGGAAGQGQQDGLGQELGADLA